MDKLKIGKRVGVLFFNMMENKDELREGIIIARTQKPYRWVVCFDDGGLQITTKDRLFPIYDKEAFKKYKMGNLLKRVNDINNECKAAQARFKK